MIFVIAMMLKTTLMGGILEVVVGIQIGFVVFIIEKMLILMIAKSMKKLSL